MKQLVRTVSFGLIYLLLGWIGLALAIPPGYASPVFPAAGLAVAIVLYFGKRILPSVWLGSISINILVAIQNGNCNLVGILIAAILAFGATLQALGAYYIVKRWRRDLWHKIETEKDAIIFLLLSGPIASLVSATVGISTLFLFKIIPPSEYLFSWWNWWTGDTLGVLIFAPLVLIFLFRTASPWKERRVAVTLPMLLTLLLVGTAYLGITHWERNRLNQKIEDYGKQIVQLLDHRFIAHQEVLASLSRLIEELPDMTYQQFEHFTKLTIHENPDIFALSYNPYITHRQKQAFEQSMAKKSPLPHFMITERDPQKNLTPAADRPAYVAVQYIYPLIGNQPAIGFDINSEPIRRDAIERALKSQKIALTQPLRLVQEQQERPGVLLLQPAYKIRDNESVPHQLIGFAVGVIKIDEMIRIAMEKKIRDDFVISITDPLAENNKQLLFRSDNGESKPATAFSSKFQIIKADRLWYIEVSPTESFLKNNRTWIAWSTGIVGLIFATLLQILLLAMTGRNSTISQKVKEQTLELTQTKNELEQINNTLQRRIDETIFELRKQDQVLITQGRQAAMGEMIANIAHQWRQPLNALSMLITNIFSLYDSNQLTKTYMAETFATADNLIQKMSSTINDFRNFFKQDKEVVAFSALEQLRAARNLMDHAFQNNRIYVTIDAVSDCRLKGHPNEYSQVLINLLCNAIDAIQEAGIPDGQIYITLTQHDGAGRVSIRDNGGGIKEDMLKKIFEPYFSTKPSGTGIGLYMSKTIIERNMTGTLTVNPIENGTEFVVSLPVAKEPDDERP